MNSRGRSATESTDTGIPRPRSRVEATQNFRRRTKPRPPESPAATDNNSKTIVLVEARREIPWTKPDDIHLAPDPAQQLPNFGGFFGGLLQAGFNDSEVIAVSQTTDPATLHPFFTAAGGNQAEREKIAVP